MGKFQMKVENSKLLLFHVIKIALVILYCSTNNASLALAQSESSQPFFRKVALTVASKKIMVELAETPEQRAFGLMYRKTLGENDGMLFIFESEESLAFWMKNTFIPLSIGYFDKHKRLVDVQEMVPFKGEMDSKNYPSKKKSMYALEMNPQWYKKNKIKVGDKFSF